MTILKTPVNGAPVEMLTAQQRRFLQEAEHAYNDHNSDWKHLERMNRDDHTQPPKLVFSWETDWGESILEISENEDFTSSRRIKTKCLQMEVNNFKAACTYYWRVNDSEVYCFTTEDILPRWIEVGGLTNVRDAGNWKTKYGCPIKQGLLYRGSEMNIHHTITEEGKKVLCEDLQIKTDLDLRGEGLELPASPMGENVNLVVIPIGPYHLFMQNYRKECKELFELLCDESNYPIYYHCWGGADRTGTLAFLLGVVLGMSETDLFLDYELTSLAIWGDRSCKSDLFQSFIRELQLYAGKNISEQACNFLLSCGVTLEQMQKLRHIFLGKEEYRLEADFSYGKS